MLRALMPINPVPRVGTGPDCDLQPSLWVRDTSLEEKGRKVVIETGLTNLGELIVRPNDRLIDRD